jgi:hypothetical protein
MNLPGSAALASKHVFIGSPDDTMDPPVIYMFPVEVTQPPVYLRFPE